MNSSVPARNRRPRWAQKAVGDQLPAPTASAVGVLLQNHHTPAPTTRHRTGSGVGGPRPLPGRPRHQRRRGSGATGRVAPPHGASGMQTRDRNPPARTCCSTSLPGSFLDWCGPGTTRPAVASRRTAASGLDPRLDKSPPKAPVHRTTKAPCVGWDGQAGRVHRQQPRSGSEPAAGRVAWS